MKTIKQVQNKAKRLLEEYKKEEPREDLVSVYERKLDDFIGDFWDYSYFERQKLSEIRADFFDEL